MKEVVEKNITNKSFNTFHLIFMQRQHIAQKKLGCRNIPHDSRKTIFSLIFFVLKPTPKSPSTRSCIKGGIFRRTKWGKAEHT